MIDKTNIMIGPKMGARPMIGQIGLGAGLVFRGRSGSTLEINLLHGILR